MRGIRSIWVLFAISQVFLSGSCKSSNSIHEKPRVLVVCGGHDFDTIEFFNVFKSMKSIDFDTIMQPRASQLIGKQEFSDYNVFVFYDMWPEIDSSGKEGFFHLLEQHKGLVFLHHSLCSYQNWKQYSEILGGKYYTEMSGTPDSMLSNYKHDIDIDIRVLDDKHPITKGISDFTIHDEGYSNITVDDDAEILLATNHPDCSEQVCWINHFNESEVVYLMLGHNTRAYENKYFSRILENSIIYLSGN